MKRHGRAESAEYYDREWRQDYKNRHTSSRLGWERRLALAQHAAAYLVGSSVLDLGCGYGELARFVKGTYLGIDFSPFVIEKAKEMKLGAQFLVADILDLPDVGQFDTVAMLEVLEHMDDPPHVINLVRPLARRRIVISVPKRSYSGSDPYCHVWPTWSPQDVTDLLGPGSVCHDFRRWRIGVSDINRR